MSTDPIEPVEAWRIPAGEAGPRHVVGVPNTLTPDAVRARVEVIRKNARDYERAHSQEDELMSDVLQAIAEGHDAPREIAAIALTTRDIKFARYCA